MKAITRTRYGSPDVLQLAEVERPTPKDTQVLVAVRAASVNALDWHLMRGEPFPARLGGNGLRKPKHQRLGVDLAGRIEAAGGKVTRFQVGDEVFGLGSGAFAESACANEDELVTKPAAITFDEAAAVPVAAATALQGLRDHGQLQPGQQVLIDGASGGVGTFAVQIAKALGAEVTAVCSLRNMEMARSLGADHIIDYTREDFIKNAQSYDLILAINGYHPLWAYRRALRPVGRYVMVGASKAHLMQGVFQVMLLGPLMSRKGGQKMSNFLANPKPADLEFLKDLLETGKLKSVIERRYPLSETADAVRYVEAGHASGKIVITM